MYAFNANNDASEVVINNLSENIIDEESQLKQEKIEKLEEKNKLAICCASSCLCFSIIALVCVAIGYIAWLVFAIKAISNTSNGDIKDKCSKSDLWPLMLVIIIVSGCSILSSLNQNNKKKEEEDSNSEMISIMFQFCFQVALTVWTGIELNTSCAKDNLDDENIYILLHYWFYFGCVSIVVSIVVVSLRGCINLL